VQVPTPRIPAAALALAGLIVAAAPAAAQPPPNDSPFGAAPFESFTAADGTPRDQEAIAELVEAGPDPGVPACLGPRSFKRTAWYSVPPMETPQGITVEAEGKTIAPLDLAAFVQPPGGTPRATITPNACDGVGGGGSDAAEEPTSAVSLDIPAGQGALIQVGRHGRVGSPDDERALLSLDARPLPVRTPPRGDVANGSTPSASLRHGVHVPLAGATISQEDPAEAPCPSLGTVWRKVVPRTKGTRVVSVESQAASTLTVFSGRRPTGNDALDCVVRARPGRLEMRVPIRKKRALWIRIGADRPAASASAALRIQDLPGAKVIDGGPGGFDPTTGGPGGGLPFACGKSSLARARLGGPRFRLSAAALNRRSTVPIRVRVRNSIVCNVGVVLRGPHRHIYARTQVVSLKGRRTVRLRRVRHLVRGAYRVQATANSELGGTAAVRGSVPGRLVK
jgi:hypothetical protein